MDIIRDKLKELGFKRINKKSDDFDWTYEYMISVSRDATYFIYITSHPFWFFKFEIEKHGHETGVEGYERHTVFDGHIDPDNCIEFVEKLFSETGIKEILSKGTNELLSQ